MYQSGSLDSGYSCVVKPTWFQPSPFGRFYGDFFRVTKNSFSILHFLPLLVSLFTVSFYFKSSKESFITKNVAWFEKMMWLGGLA